MTQISAAHPRETSTSAHQIYARDSSCRCFHRTLRSLHCRKNEHPSAGENKRTKCDICTHKNMTHRFKKEKSCVIWSNMGEPLKFCDEKRTQTNQARPDTVAHTIKFCIRASQTIRLIGAVEAGLSGGGEAARRGCYTGLFLRALATQVASCKIPRPHL